MRRSIRLYFAFVRNCVRQAAEFRANFWASVVTNVGWMLSLLIFLGLIYHNTNAVAGWTQPQMFVLFGAYTSLRGIGNALFYQNLSQIPLFVRMGQMDWILTKPVDSQFYVSLRFVDLSDLGSLFGGLVVLGVGIAGLGHRQMPSAAAWACFAVMLVCGIVLMYAMTMLLMTLSIWLIRLDNLMVLSDTVFQIARTPIDIFRAFGRAPIILLTYVLPLAFIAAMPVKEIFGQIDPVKAAVSAVGLAAAFFTASRVFWLYAARSYSSASS